MLTIVLNVFYWLIYAILRIIFLLVNIALSNNNIIGVIVILIIGQVVYHNIFKKLISYFDNKDKQRRGGGGLYSRGITIPPSSPAIISTPEPKHHHNNSTIDMSSHGGQQQHQNVTLNITSTTLNKSSNESLSSIRSPQPLNDHSRATGLSSFKDFKRAQQSSSSSTEMKETCAPAPIQHSPIGQLKSSASAPSSSSLSSSSSSSSSSMFDSLRQSKYLPYIKQAVLILVIYPATIVVLEFIAHYLHMSFRSHVTVVERSYAQMSILLAGLYSRIAIIITGYYQQVIDLFRQSTDLYRQSTNLYRQSTDLYMQSIVLSTHTIYDMKEWVLTIDTRYLSVSLAAGILLNLAVDWDVKRTNLRMLSVIMYACTMIGLGRKQGYDDVISRSIDRGGDVDDISLSDRTSSVHHHHGDSLDTDRSRDTIDSTAATASVATTHVTHTVTHTTTAAAAGNGDDDDASRFERSGLEYVHQLMSEFNAKLNLPPPTSSSSSAAASSSLATEITATPLFDNRSSTSWLDKDLPLPSIATSSSSSSSNQHTEPMNTSIIEPTGDNLTVFPATAVYDELDLSKKKDDINDGDSKTMKIVAWMIHYSPTIIVALLQGFALRYLYHYASVSATHLLIQYYMEISLLLACPLIIYLLYFITRRWLKSRADRIVVVDHLCIIVKAILQRHDRPYPVSYLFEEVQDLLLIHRQQLSTAGIKSPALDAVVGDAHIVIPNMHGYRLDQLWWNDVKRLVEKDQRIQANDLIVDGKKQRCWRILSANTQARL